MKILKNGQKYAIKFDRKGKNAKHTCHQQIYYKLKNRGGGRGGYSVLVNYQFLSNFFSLAAPNYFSVWTVYEIDYSVWVLSNNSIL